MSRRSHAGFTLVELTVVMVVMAILGTALTRILISDSRFVDKVDAMMAARQAARAAMNVMSLELQMVGDSGVIEPTDANQVTFRVPIAFGVACGMQAGRTIAAMAPSDSATLAGASVSGLTFDTSGVTRVITNFGVATSNGAGPCASNDINLLSGGWYARISRPNIIPIGTPFYFFEQVRYRFGNSTQLPGRRALFRVNGLGTTEELVAPFGDSAGFIFLVGDALERRTTPPTILDSIKGLELRLTGESYLTPQGETDPAEFDLRTAVVFRNKN